MIQVLEPDDFPVDFLLQSLPAVEVVFGPQPPSISSAVTHLFVRLGYYIDESFLQHYPNLRYIYSPTTALMHIDINVLKLRRVKLRYMANHREVLDSITSTVELTIFHILGIARKFFLAVKGRHHSVNDRYLYKSKQISSLTVGIIGYGRIGSKVASILEILGSRVLINDPMLSESVMADSRITSVSLKDLVERSDIAVMAAAATLSDGVANKQILTRNVLRHVKAGAFFVNTARGELWDEEYLVELLSDKVISGIATDVLSGETSDGVGGLVGLADDPDVNVVVTPHIGGMASDALARCEEALLKDCVSDQCSRPPKHLDHEV